MFPCSQWVFPVAIFRVFPVVPMFPSKFPVPTSQDVLICGHTSVFLETVGDMTGHVGFGIEESKNVVLRMNS